MREPFLASNTESVRSSPESIRHYGTQVLLSELHNKWTRGALLRRWAAFDPSGAIDYKDHDFKGSVDVRWEMRLRLRFDAWSRPMLDAIRAEATTLRCRCCTGMTLVTSGVTVFLYWARVFFLGLLDVLPDWVWDSLENARVGVETFFSENFRTWFDVSMGGMTFADVPSPSDYLRSAPCVAVFGGVSDACFGAQLAQLLQSFVALCGSGDGWHGRWLIDFFESCTDTRPIVAFCYDEQASPPDWSSMLVWRRNNPGFWKRVEDAESDVKSFYDWHKKDVANQFLMAAWSHLWVHSRKRVLTSPDPSYVWVNGSWMENEYNQLCNAQYVGGKPIHWSPLAADILERGRKWNSQDPLQLAFGRASVAFLSDCAWEPVFNFCGSAAWASLKHVCFLSSYVFHGRASHPSRLQRVCLLWGLAECRCA